MINRIIKTELIDWRKIKPLQPENAKIIFNYKDIEASIERYGFSQPFYIWENNGEFYCIDGHTRIEVLNNIESVPDKLPATFIDAKSRKEAIEILIEVYNQKHNPFDIQILEGFIEVEQVDVNLEQLNIIRNFDTGHDINNLSEFDLDLSEKFDPVGTSKGIQRVVFIFDGPDEAESYLNNLRVKFEKRNMAWQVNLSTRFI